ncbi:Golgin-45 [Stylophora pistillata]|uniref:Golgin-45 n=1 Tax=Stylophora pistillata TaxID=50429 RepID=A0A2B4RC80_STYPI|nr:Golgin-45 [Stylophora pistillata]
MSSANSAMELLTDTAAISLTFIRNIEGPKLYPCGTPVITGKSGFIYSKLPRSSGDGIEFSSSNSSNDSLYEDNEESDLTQKANDILLSPTIKRKSAGKRIENRSAQISAGPELLQSNNESRLSCSATAQLVSLAPPAVDLSFGDGLLKSTVVEQKAEFVDSQKVISDLQEQNAKLVEEKTKLSVQLGVQTKVWLEDLVNRNVQQTVELNHWKKICEEYSEESDRLEIECDVWRTKFLGSRMSDELSSWKATLYTRFRQAQSALQWLLEERGQLQQYLTHTKRLIQSLYLMLKSTSGIHQGPFTSSQTSNDQSILEMASTNKSLAEQTLGVAQNVLPAFSLAETSLILTREPLETGTEQQVEPTSAEKTGFTVLRIATTQGQSSLSSEGNTTTQVKFPTICANNPIKSTALPLGYQGNVKPDAAEQCDLPECMMSAQNDDWKVLTGCFHSFHNTCLNGLNSHPLCKDFLKKKVQELGQTAKQDILNPNSSSEVPVPAVSQDIENERSDSGLDSPTETTTAREMEKDEYQNTLRQLNHEIASLNPTSQPFPISSNNQRLSRAASNTSETTTKVPLRCRKWHHPVCGHKRSNRSQVKCDFCPNNVCTVNSGNSFSRCNCS